MLSVENVSAGYGKISVLSEISIRLESNSILGVLGRNGMGKSTLIKVLSGLLTCHSGKIFLDNEDITDYPPHLRSQKKIATIVQGRGIFPRLKVVENLMLGKLLQTTVKKDRLDEVYSYFPILSERNSQVAGTLSGGEQQMLTMCRTLMGDPEVIMIDEPTEGLSPQMTTRVADLLNEISSRGVSILLVEQKLSIAMKISNRVYVMGHGQIVFEGTPKELEKRDDIRKEWLEV